MKKIITAATFMAILLLGQMVCQVCTTAAKAPTEPETKVIVQTETQYIAEQRWDDVFTFTDNEKEVTVVRKLNVTRIDYLNVRDGIWFNQIVVIGYLLIDGEKMEIDFRTTKYPRDKLYEAFGMQSTSLAQESTPCASTTSLPTHMWYGIVFAENSKQFHVEYSHPHNIPNHEPVYDIDPNEGVPTNILGEKREERVSHSSMDNQRLG